MDEQVNNETEAEAIGRLARQGVYGEHRVITDPRDGTQAVLAVTSGEDGEVRFGPLAGHLDSFRDRPLFRQGTAAIDRLDSLIGHAQRFKLDETAAFVVENRAEIGVVYDYHPCPNGDIATKAGAKRHSALYKASLSREWNRWMGAADAVMEQGDFAEFIEDNIADVMAVPAFLTDGKTNPESDADQKLKDLLVKIQGKPCGPEKLMELSRGLAVFSHEEARVEVKLQSGEARIVASQEHCDKDGKPLTVPSLFLIAIPVFDGGPVWRVPVRMRYRKRGGGLVWILQPYDTDRIRRVAFEEDVARFEAETGLPVFWGHSER